ncbi:hypothetical protein VNI00_006833 [Paramarasmius palmivorus]|uniref:F-box domain-containing protein n=1 Tax=Paramarasmius palmivorus TaxID=297713 RepID=A0AAW0DAK2_9AGAR
MEFLNAAHPGRTAFHTAFHFITSPILRLPDELKLLIFTALLESTQNSAALISLAATCQSFRRIIVGEPKLWNRVGADTSLFAFDKNFGFSVPEDPAKAWKALEQVVERSLPPNYDILSPPPLSFVIDFVVNATLPKYVEARLTKQLSEAHIDWLVDFFFDRCSHRCSHLTVRCSDWELMNSIMGLFDPDDVDGPYPSLSSITLEYVPPGRGYLPAHPAGELVPSSPLAFYPRSEASEIFQDTSQYSVYMIPSLTGVVLDGFPLMYEHFCPDALTSLAIRNVSQETDDLDFGALVQVLKRNCNTLRSLKLGVGALPLDVPEIYAKIVLPKLTELEVDYLDPREMLYLTTYIEVPSLTRLTIANSIESNPRFDLKTYLFNDMAQYTIAAYKAVLKSWPLQQVIHLGLRSAAFYNTVDNPVYDLENCHKRWNGPMPVSSEFFYRFEALETYSFKDPDLTVSLTIWNPLYFKDENGEFVERKFFPKLRRPLVRS